MGSGFSSVGRAFDCSSSSITVCYQNVVGSIPTNRKI